MTKKLLLGSTAIVGGFVIAAPAFADIEVTLSGQVETGVKIHDEDTLDGDDTSNRGYFMFMDTETKIQAEGAADNGINYSGKVEIDTDGNNDGGTIEVQTDEAVLAFWGGFGRVELGREDGAEDVMYVGGEDFQAGTGGIDGDTENLDLANINDSGDAAKISYFTPRAGGFQAGVSFTPDEADDETGQDDDGGADEESIGLGLNFQTSAGGADVTVSGVYITADNEGDGDDKEDYGVGVGVEFAGLGIGAGYVVRDEDDEGEGYNIGAKYGFGPANVSLGYSNDEPEGADDVGVFAIAADYGLFPGVTAKADISFNDNDVDADGDKTTAGVVTLQISY